MLEKRWIGLGVQTAGFCSAPITTTATARDGQAVAVAVAFRNCTVLGVLACLTSGTHAHDLSSPQVGERSPPSDFVWRCPWNFQEVRGLLMQPTAKQVVQNTSQKGGSTPAAAHEAWSHLIADFSRYMALPSVNSSRVVCAHVCMWQPSN